MSKNMTEIREPKSFQEIPSINIPIKEEQKKNNYKEQRDRDRRPFRGVFRYHEVPGGFLEFSFRKWKEDPVEFYHINDGEICTIPYGVAEHLNTNIAYPIHAHIMDKDGKPIQVAKTMIRRCTFQSLEFMADPQFIPVGIPLTQVENI